VRDGIAFARRGRPVVILVTEKFEDEAKFVSRAVGMPDVPIVYLPHPIAGLEPADRNRVAVGVAGEVLRALGGEAVSQ
jgi:hypothetical protein